VTVPPPTEFKAIVSACCFVILVAPGNRLRFGDDGARLGGWHSNKDTQRKRRSR
jgi:hypothetical protein